MFTNNGPKIKTIKKLFLNNLYHVKEPVSLRVLPLLFTTFSSIFKIMQDARNKDEKFQIINNELEKGKQTIDLIIKGGWRVMEGTDNWNEITVYLIENWLFISTSLLSTNCISSIWLQ